MLTALSFSTLINQGCILPWFLIWQKEDELVELEGHTQCLLASCGLCLRVRMPASPPLFLISLEGPKEKVSRLYSRDRGM